MNKVAIIYNQPLTQVQGINYVNSSFVEGQRYFVENGLELVSIIGPDQVFDCEGKLKLDTIGSNRGSGSYGRKRKLREILRALLSSDYLIGAVIKFYFNYYHNAKQAVKLLMNRIDQYDYLIFQDILSARFYYACTGKQNRKKNIIIIHCSNEPLEQFRTQFKGLFKNGNIKKRIESSSEQTMRETNKVVYLSKHAISYSPVSTPSKSYVYNGKEDIDDLVIKDVSNPLNFVIVGSTIFHKGHNLLLEAIAMVDNSVRRRMHLHIIGDGNEFVTFKDMAKKLEIDDNVTFYGNRNDVPQLLKGMDVFILPSLSEGMPMSVIEAMRQGLFIMATPVGGIPEMVDSQFGIFFERNVQSIADAITHVVNDNIVTYESKLSSRGRYESDFTLRNMIYKYCNILKSI